MARYPSVNLPPRRRKHRSSFRFLMTALLTTGLIATGGFGAFPHNSLTELFQEEITQNFPETSLSPINSYLEQLSAPAIESPSASKPNPSLDLIGLFIGEPSSQTPESSNPATATETPTVFHTPSKTVTPAATSTLTATPAFTGTPTLITTQICSRPSTTPATVTFFNSSAQTINIYRVDSMCQKTLSNTLDPEQSVVQETFIGQLWWFEDASAGHLILAYVVSLARETVIVSTDTITK